PTNMAKPIMKMLIEDGEVTRGWLGISIQTVKPELRQALSLATDHGVLVTSVSKNSPAAKAGLERNDVITQVNGQKTGTAQKLQALIADAGANQTVTLEVMRGNSTRTMHVKLGTLSGEPTAQNMHGAPSGAKDDALGARVADLSSNVRAHFHIPADVTGGAVVTQVVPGSPAAFMGIRPGDVILQVNRKKVTSAKAFSNLYHNAHNQVAILIYRDGAAVYLSVPKK
ncbi:MAG TPA: PDZ domain-containing protein, partial [Kofleriaceae bacterium]|nr:PDZ domain-containing protein [Kofleriaceae bacterium]